MTCGSAACKRARKNTVDQSRRWHRVIAALTDPDFVRSLADLGVEWHPDGPDAALGEVGLRIESLDIIRRAAIENALRLEADLDLVERGIAAALSAHYLDEHPDLAEGIVRGAVLRRLRDARARAEDEALRARLAETTEYMRPS